MDDCDVYLGLCNSAIGEVFGDCLWTVDPLNGDDGINGEEDVDEWTDGDDGLLDGLLEDVGVPGLLI